MKRILTLALAGVIGLSILAGCSKKKAVKVSPEEQKQMQQKMQQKMREQMQNTQGGGG